LRKFVDFANHAAANKARQTISRRAFAAGANVTGSSRSAEIHARESYGESIAQSRPVMKVFGRGGGEIEIKSLIYKSWLGKGVAPLPFPQLVSNGVRRGAHGPTQADWQTDQPVDLLVGFVERPEI
jgi:hypothetical protein